MIDEWGHANLNATNRSDLLDIINDRCGKKSTIIVGAMPVKDWASFIGDKSMADSIMDRLVRSSHRINLEGISMRSLERYGAVMK